MLRYDTFCLTLMNLKAVYEYEAPYDNVTLTGLIGLFKYCFEQSMKMMKEILSNHGYTEIDTISSKNILKISYYAGMIQKEESWLNALQANENIFDNCSTDMMLNILKQTKNEFYDMFCELKQEVEQRWL